MNGESNTMQMVDSNTTELPTLSVVVPTFNEEDTIEACLQCLLELEDPVEEIIVVDNNSTDSNRHIISSLAEQWPAITLITAHDQGVINARSAGFDAARGDILVRVDADTRVPTQWSGAIRRFFRDHGDRFAAASGLCHCYDLPFQDHFRRGHRQITERVERALRSADPSSAAIDRLFGSNMAIRRSVWERLSPNRSRRTDIFEDLELTLQLRGVGGAIGLIPGADAGISGRRYLSSPWVYLQYCLRDQRTYRAFGRRGRAALAVVMMIAVQYPMYLAMWLPFRAYDPARRRMRPSLILRHRDGRVLPCGTESSVS